MALHPATVVRLYGLMQPHDWSLEDVIRRLIEKSAEAKKPATATRGTAGAGRYRLTILGESWTLATLGEVVGTAVDVLGTLDRRLFDRADELVGNDRNYLAPTPEELYPQRPDLAKLARRCRCGWWVPTNIGWRDACRILKLYCGVLGLSWDRDVRLEDSRKPTKGKN